MYFSHNYNVTNCAFLVIYNVADWMCKYGKGQAKGYLGFLDSKGDD